MSRGPGRIERAIRELFDASPELAFVTVELVEHCFPGVGGETDIERKHEVSVLRAAHKIVAADPDWKAKRIEGQGRGWVFFNNANVQSYALFRLIADVGPAWHCYRSPARLARAMGGWSNRLPGTREQLLALLASGGREHDLIQPGGAWVRHVEQHIAQRDGDTARAEALAREGEASFAAIMERLARAASGLRNRFVADSMIPQRNTYEMLGPVFAWLAEQVRDVATKNDPDEQRAGLKMIARNLDGLQQVVTGPNPSAALDQILDRIRAFREQRQQDEAAD